MPRGCIIIAAYLLIARFSYAGSTPQTGVNGSSHDITYLGATGTTYNQDDYQRVCIFCHTPHNAQTSATGVPAPLWNHTLSTVTLTPYQWAIPANMVIPFNADPLIGPSRLCMSCHDGVTAVDSHGPTISSSPSDPDHSQGNNNGTHLMVTTGSYIINDLKKVHPIGFLYSDAMAARPGHLVDPTTTNFLASSPYGSGCENSNTYTREGFVQGTTLIANTLYAGYVTCATCHDAHNTNNAINLPDPNTNIAPNYFVRAPEQGSSLCLSCHLM